MRAGVLAASVVVVVGSPVLATDLGPSLGAARSFAVLGATNVASTGQTTVVGDVGVSPGSDITGFPPAIVTQGAIHPTDTAAGAAHAGAAIAYDFLAGMPSIPANNLSDVDLGGLTLEPGVYKFNAAAGLTGALTLDAHGHSDALFVFQIGTSLTTATNASVVVINGGGNYDESRVFWQVGSSATLGSGTVFTGNIVAYASISLVTGSTLQGSALALTGAVTMEGNALTSPRLSALATRPAAGRTSLTPPVGAVDVNAVVRLDVKHFPAKRSREERSWFRARVRHLDASTEFTLWADDPSTLLTTLVQFASFTTKHKGNFNFDLDTKNGDAMPFGATLLALQGMAIEVRDAAGTTVIVAGTIPTTLP